MNQRRPRGRNNSGSNSNNSNNNNNRSRHQAPRNQNFDSNGPEGRVRGSATQVLDRYLAQARDAQAAGDGVLAENLFQHAEHYYRVLSIANAQFEQQQRERQSVDERDRRSPRGENQNDNGGDEGENQQRDGPMRDNLRSDSDTHPEGNRGREAWQREDSRGDAQRREQREEPRSKPEQAEEPASDQDAAMMSAPVPVEEAPTLPRPRVRRRAPASARQAVTADTPVVDTPVVEAPVVEEPPTEGSGAEIDAAFLKEAPKPRRRRKPAAEIKAAD